MLRLSPNEEIRIFKEETERRRKERLAQVREKARIHASKVRDAVKMEKARQLRTLAAQIEADWEEERAERMMQLLCLQDACLKALGQGHTAAKIWDPKHEERVQLMLEDNWRAERRHREALKRLQDEQAARSEQTQKVTVPRLMAREKERLRAKHVASLPPRPADPLLAALGTSDQPPASLEAETVGCHRQAEDCQYDEAPDGAAVHQVRRTIVVQRAKRASPTGAGQGDSFDESMPRGNGRLAAQHEEARVAQAREEAARKETERQEMARLRHKHALHKEVLHKDYQQLLVELDDLQRADRRRRQQVLERIPRSLYLPPHVVIEKEAERQEEMERQFEELYESVAGNAADIRGLVDEAAPLGGTSTASEDTDSALVDDVPPSCPDGRLQSYGRSPLRDVTNAGEVVPGVTGAGNDRLQAKLKKRAMKKLMTKIEDQKNSWLVNTLREDEATASEAEAPDEPGILSQADGGLSSPGVSTVSSGNALTSPEGVVSTPTLSQYTMDSDEMPASRTAKAVPNVPAAPMADMMQPQVCPPDQAPLSHGMVVPCKDIAKVQDADELSSEEPLDWIEQQKLELQQRVEAIAAQRYALESLQKAAQNKLRAASEGTGEDTTLRPIAGDRESVREQRIREYQERLLTRNSSSASQHATLGRSDAPKDTISVERQHCHNTLPLRHVHGDSKMQQHYHLHGDPRPAHPRGDQKYTKTDGFSSQIITTSAAKVLSTAERSLNEISDDSSSSDSARYASEVPGYIPPWEREALLDGFSATLPVRYMPSASSHPVGPTSPQLTHAVQLEHSIISGERCVPVSKADTAAKDDLSYVTVQERERLLATAFSVGPPRLAAASSALDKSQVPAAAHVHTTLGPAMAEPQLHSSHSSAAQSARLRADSGRMPAGSADAETIAMELNPIYSRYQPLQAQPLVEVGRGTSSTLRNNGHDAAAAAIFSTALAQQMLERQQAFNRRQDELRQQLAEIQRQKREILARQQSQSADSMAWNPPLLRADNKYDRSGNNLASAALSVPASGMPSHDTGHGRPVEYHEENGTSPLDEMSISRHLLSTIQEVDDTQSKLGDDDDELDVAAGASPNGSYMTRNSHLSSTTGCDHKTVESSVVSYLSPSAAGAQLIPPAQQSSQPDQVCLNPGSEAELSSGTLVTSGSSLSAGAASSYNPLPLDCSAGATDPSSGSTTDLVIENSLWPSKPYEVGALSSAMCSSSLSTGSSPSTGGSSSSPMAAAAALHTDESRASPVSGSSSSFKPLPLYDSSSNNEKSIGSSAAPVSSTSEADNDGPMQDMTDSADGYKNELQPKDRVSLTAYDQSITSAAHSITMTPSPCRSIAGVMPDAVCPIAYASEDEYEFSSVRPHSSTPLKYQTPGFQHGALYSFADPLAANEMSCYSDISLPSGVGISNEQELTFISLSASSAQCESEHDEAGTTVMSAQQSCCNMQSIGFATTGSVPQHQTKDRQKTAPVAKQTTLTASGRKKLDQESKLRTKQLYERLEEVQAQKKIKAFEQARLLAPARRIEYDMKLKQRKQKSTQQS